MSVISDANTIFVKQLLTTDDYGDAVIDCGKCTILQSKSSCFNKISCNNLSCCDIKNAFEILLLICASCEKAIYFEFNDNILPDRLPNGDPNEDVKDFFTLIKDKLRENIQYLDFTGSTLYSVLNLNAILNKLPQLISLNLSKTNIVQLLSSVVTNMPSTNKILINIPISIRELIISNVKLQDFNVECFIHDSFDYLENLDLSNNKISKGIEIITKYDFPSLSTLSLQNNEIDSKSGKAIGEWIMRSKHLKLIDFSGNNLGNDGVTDITVNLKKLKELNEIYFSLNNIDDTGFANLIKSCSTLKNLKHINVSENNITMNNVIDLKKNNFAKLSVEILSIYGNPIREFDDVYNKYFNSMLKLKELRVK